MSERRPDSVDGSGQEPDARFSLANERTALAWVRTCLSVISGGVGLIVLASIRPLPKGLEVVAALCIVSGVLLAIRAYVSWKAIEVALRTGQPMPPQNGLRFLIGVVVCIGCIALVSAIGVFF